MQFFIHSSRSDLVFYAFTDINSFLDHYICFLKSISMFSLEENMEHIPLENDPLLHPLKLAVSGIKLGDSTFIGSRFLNVTAVTTGYNI